MYADLAVGMGAPDFESVAGLPRPSDWLYETVRERGLAPIILPSSGSFDFRHVMRLVSTVRNRRIDVLQAHTFGSSVYASLAGFLCGIPVVCTLHGRVDLAAGDRHRSLKFRILSLGRTFLVPVSASLRDELIATTQIRPDSTRVIYNGVDTETFLPGRDSQIRKELGIGEDEIIIGAVGNVRPVKGYEVLLNAAALLLDRGLRFRIVIVGQTIDKSFADIQRQCRDLGLDNIVVFAGFRKNTADFYRAFDVYALTSHSEGFPLSTLQALSSGLPIVATRCGGPEEMLEDGVTGLFGEVASAADIADKLETLITDSTLRRRMGQAGRSLALAKYSTGSMLREYGDLYHALVERRQPVVSANGEHPAANQERTRRKTKQASAQSSASRTSTLRV